MRNFQYMLPNPSPPYQFFWRNYSYHGNRDRKIFRQASWGNQYSKGRKYCRSDPEKKEKESKVDAASPPPALTTVENPGAVALSTQVRCKRSSKGCLA
jgi:hypothetical protein